jgi:hypothetical protein
MFILYPSVGIVDYNKRYGACLNYLRPFDPNLFVVIQTPNTAAHSMALFKE